MDYTIIQAASVADMIKQTKALMKKGWQPASPVLVFGHSLIHEMVLPPKPNNDIEAANRLIVEQFGRKYDELDSRLRDLLEVNGIRFVCQNGKLYTSTENKIMEGISPAEVLALLKASKHCPLDLDDQWVLNEIEGLL